MAFQCSYSEEKSALTSRSTKFYFLVTFWGEVFRRYLCDLAIPSLLAKGNIPALKYPADAKFVVAAPKVDCDALSREPSFQALCGLIAAEFLPVEDTDPPMHKYVRMSRGHAMLADLCFRDKAFAFNVNPDSIYPDGCVAEGQRLVLNEGNDVVLCAAIRFEIEGIVEALRRAGRMLPGSPISITMREAVAVGLKNLHSESLASDWEAPNFARLHPQHGRKHYLTCCFWRIPGEDGLCIITHNWAPLLVNYEVLLHHDTSALDGRAIDGDYIFQNFPQQGARIHVVTDSDSLFLLGMTPKDEMIPPADRLWWRRWGELGEWTKGLILNRTVFDRAVDSYRRTLYRTYVRWHSRDINERWGDVERKVAFLIETYVSQDIESPGARLGLLQSSFNRFVSRSLF